MLWKCGKCGKIYSFEELNKLKIVPLVPEDEDPFRQHGFTYVCECGYVFHRDRWHIVTNFKKKVKVGFLRRINLKGRVSTVFLELNHGDVENPLWYETMVFIDDPGNIECDLCIRYRTQDEAEKGHKKVVEAIKSGKLKIVPIKYKLIFPKKWKLIIEDIREAR